MVKNIEKAKSHCLQVLSKKKNRICAYLPTHIRSVQNWAEKLAKDYPRANKEILLLSVWLHDIGHALSNHENHHIKSEMEARKFLKTIKLSPEKIEKVAHCVRAHRCKDVKPETIEAKILAAADSASHFTDGCYMDMAMDVPKKQTLEKLDRDYRDVGIFPKLKREITPIYKAWKNLLKAYPSPHKEAKR